MGNGMNKIVPGLYVGNIKDAENVKQLEENGITHIISIHDQRKVKYPNKVYLAVDAADESCQDLCQYFHECTKFIHDARLSGGTVLVHCLGGISRSVTVATAYLMTVTSHNWNDALSAIQQARPIAKPNRGFREQLHEFQRDDISNERAWFHETYGLNKFDDEVQVKVLANQFYAAEKENELRQRKFMEASDGSGSMDSGSFSSKLPLNQPDETSQPNSAMAVNALMKKRQGGLYLDDS